MVFSLYSAPTAAEYRVFVLKIQMPGEEGGKLIKSTLDPEQYRGYYPVPDGATVTYVETWRCFGRTGLQPMCDNPKAAANTEPEAQTGKAPSETPKKGPERTPAATKDSAT